MDTELELLAAILAVQSGLVGRQDLLSAAEAWRGSGRSTLWRLVKKRAGLSEKEAEVAKALAEAVAGRHEGSAARALEATEPGLRDAVRARMERAAKDRSTALRPEGTAPDDEPVTGEAVAERYRLGREIARGGIGRIVEAVDGALGRDVAVKLVLDGVTPELKVRFTREAKLTARLDHPNVVPVYDFGELSDVDGKSRLFLSMKRIRGRDLSSMLQGIAVGEGKLAETWSRQRLLRVFQDVCMGVAYAHSKGVIHRDLKPSNVMIGDYGETLIVDWGLAKALGEAEPLPDRASAIGKFRSSTSIHRSAGDLTMAGEILGTPAYMSPEQAEGRVEDVDARSDIYALGTILYEILTHRPPVEGEFLLDVIQKVIDGKWPKPSQVADVPPELERICLRAMAKRREDRYGSATDLHRDVQRFLEGSEARNRSRREADKALAEGCGSLDAAASMAEKAAGQSAEVERLKGSIPAHAGAKAKRPLWEAERRLKALREERIQAAARGASLIEQAARTDPGNPGAEEARCELLFARCVAAAAARDSEALLAARLSLGESDATGRWRARLDAPGTLHLRAWTYSCDCLRGPAPAGFAVKLLEEESLAWRDGRPRPGEEAGPRNLPVPRLSVRGRRGHGPGCGREEVVGAEVTIGRYEERDKKLVLVDERVLGKTPLAGVALPQGSWLLDIENAGCGARVPVQIRRGERWVQDVTLYGADEMPAGFLPVAGGPFVWTEGSAERSRERVATTEDVFVSKFALTIGEYLEFLNDLCASGRIDLARSVAPGPQREEMWALEETSAGPRYRLPASGTRPIESWSPAQPVHFISWTAALRYCEWRSLREGRVVTPLHEEEYEKAARGVDGRACTYGNEPEPAYAHFSISLEGGARPLPADTFPDDESPYGIRGLCGGMATWCLNDVELPYRGNRAVRGVAWNSPYMETRASVRQAYTPNSMTWHIGLRLAIRPLAWD